MAVLGDMVVNLTANTSKFDRGMKQAQGGVQRFGGIAKKVLGVAVVSSLTAMGVAAYKTAQQFRELDSAAKTADKLGIAAHNMAGLGLAFEQTGLDAKAGFTAMQRMVRRIQDIKSETDPTAVALAKLGLTVKEMIGLSPEQALARVADGMQGVKDQAERVSIAFKLFDTEGVAMVNTLAGGSEGLRKYQQVAKSLNLSHTREELARVERANDAVNRATKAMAAGWETVAISVAPQIERLAAKIATLTATTIRFADVLTSHLQPAVDIVSRQFEGWVAYLDKVGKGLELINKRQQLLDGKRKSNKARRMEEKRLQRAAEVASTPALSASTTAGKYVETGDPNDPRSRYYVAPKTPRTFAGTQYAQRGSQGAANTIYANMQGGAANPGEKIVKELKAEHKTLRGIAKVMKRQKDRTAALKIQGAV